MFTDKFEYMWIFRRVYIEQKEKIWKFRNIHIYSVWTFIGARAHRAFKYTYFTNVRYILK